MLLAGPLATLGALGEEEVPVEMLAIGDLVLVEPRTGTRAVSARVVALKAARHGETKRLVGWLVTVVGRRHLWLRRGETISRRCRRR